MAAAALGLAALTFLTVMTGRNVIRNMQQRAELLGGTATVSADSAGTLVLWSVPSGPS